MLSLCLFFIYFFLEKRQKRQKRHDKMPVSPIFPLVSFFVYFFLSSFSLLKLDNLFVTFSINRFFSLLRKKKEALSQVPQSVDNQNLKTIIHKNKKWFNELFHIFRCCFPFDEVSQFLCKRVLCTFLYFDLYRLQWRCSVFHELCHYLSIVLVLSCFQHCL